MKMELKVMANRIKSINLCEMTEPIATSISANGGNFSKFVRECLIRYHAETGGAMNCTRGLRDLTDVEIRLGKPDDRLCRPFGNGRGGRCIVCWPTGSPTDADWTEYTQGPDKYETRRRTHNNLPDDPAGTAEYLTDPEHEHFPGWYAKGEKHEVLIYAASEHFNDHVWIQERTLEQNPPLFDLTDLEIKGNAKPTIKSRRRRRSLIRWILRY